MLLGLIDDFYACALGEMDWVAVLPKVKEFFGSKEAIVGAGDLDAKRTRFREPYDSMEDLCVELNQNWEQYDNPWARSFFSLQSQPVFFRSMVFHGARRVDIQDYKASNVYRDLGRKHNITDYISIPLYTNTNMPLSIGLFNNNQEAYFSERMSNFAECLAPHILRATKIVESLELKSMIDADNNNLSYIRITSDWDLVDAKAKTVDQLSDIIKIDKYTKKVDFKQGHIKKIINSFMSQPELSDSLAGFSSKIFKTIPYNDKYSIEVYKQTATWSFFHENPYVDEYVLVFKPLCADALMSENFENVFINQKKPHYRLTKTERNISENIQLGLSPSQIANKLGVKVSTVRWHIKNIYNKLGVSSQREFLVKSLS